jgi:ATP-dependent Clp protease ATP-binding subunit ClpC
LAAHRPDRPTLDEAQRLQRGGKLAEAIAAFEALLSHEPDHVEARLGLAHCHLQLGRPTYAVEAYEVLVHQQPNSVALHCELGDTLARLGCYEASLDAFGTALKLHPGKARALLGRAEAQRLLGLFDQALETYTEVLAGDPGSASAARGKAACLSALGRYEEAVPAWEVAVSLAPGHDDALRGHREARHAVVVGSHRGSLVLEPGLASLGRQGNWARALARDGRHAEAIAAFEVAVQDAPRPDLWAALARAQGKGPHPEDALATWLKVREADPEHVEARVQIGEGLRRARRFVEALASYDQALQLDATSVAAHVGRAEALRCMGRLMEAVDNFQRALDLQPTHVEALVGQASTLGALGRSAKAEPLWRRALALQPGRSDLAEALQACRDSAASERHEAVREQAKSHFDRGRRRLKAGRNREAASAFREAIELDEDYVAAYYLLGLALVEARELEEAVEAFDAVLEREGEHLDAAWRRADALRQLGQHVAALEAYDEVLGRDPEEPRAAAGRGDVLRQMGHHEAAMPWFDKALARRPRNLVALAGKAATLNALRRFEEAHGLWLTALQDAPNHAAIKRGLAECRRGIAARDRSEGAQLPVPAAPTALSVRRSRVRSRDDFDQGRRLYKQRHYKEAAAAFRRVLEVEPVHAEAALRLGMALEDDGQFSEAIRAYRLCLSIDPTHCQAATNIGEALRKSEDYERAIRAYDRALTLRADYLYALAGRAECMRMLGDLQGSIEWFDRALAVGPRHAFAVQGKAAALNALRRFDEAHPLWEQALEIEPSSSFAADGKAACERHLESTDDEEESSETPQLDEQGRDLTALAKAGELPPVIGRSQEIRQVMKTLVRRLKANPLLLGEPGVGKTAVVEGVARILASDEAPPRLAGLRIVELSMGSLIAGTKYRGTFEERLRDLVAEARSTPNLVLFIDEIHTLVGAGRTEGGALDAANILKPALARGEITVIGATTVDEYRKHFEADSALDRRFQPIRVEEPSEAETLELLTKVAPLYESHHDVTVLRESLRACVRMSVRFVPERRLPDKALDLLDEACADASLSNVDRVDAERVALVVSERTGVPVHTLTEEERGRLESLPASLSRRVIAQDEAIAELVSAVRVARSGLRDPNRPRGVFLFAGGSGVGKTELARALADELFPEGDALIKLDMSEYADRFTGSRLLGAPPGYQGHGEEGQLTGPLRGRPYAVVLLDEFEKAHPDVQAMFLSLFDEGVVTDSEGRRVVAREAFFILTTNAGSEAGSRKAMGFGGNPRDAALERVRRHFRPELYNRLDGVVVFRSMSPDTLAQVTDLHLGRLAARAGEQGVQLTWDDSVVAACVSHRPDPSLGARPALRAIDELVAEPLGRRLLSTDCPPVLHARWVDGEVVFDAPQQVRSTGVPSGQADDEPVA